MVAVTSLPIGCTRLPAASAVALRYRSLPLVNTISRVRIILINTLTQKMSTVTFKGILLFNAVTPSRVCLGLLRGTLKGLLHGPPKGLVYGTP